MDNFDLVNFNEGQELPDPASEVEDKPIPFDDSDPPQTNQVSRKPLTLGSSTPGAKPAPKPVQQPATRPVAKPAPAQAAASAGGVGSAAKPGRITHLKTFFTKLHPGALVFLDEQVTDWLKAHPEASIKTTNVTVGEVQDKRTEPNLVINIWY